MGAYVVLTIFLFQKGSSESKPIGERTPQDEVPRTARTTPTPRGRCDAAASRWCCTRTPSRSSSSCFVLSVWLHAVGGAEQILAEQAEHGLSGVTTLDHPTAQFWFESMQNSQSQFLAVAALVGAPSSSVSGACPTQARGGPAP